METSEAKELLESILQKNNFSKSNMDCNAAWISFKEFSKQQFNVSDDALLWETGVFNFTGTDLFNYSMCRQFEFVPTGNSEGLEQLWFTLYFKPNNELSKLQKTIWTYDFGDDFEEFFQNVESQDSFLLPPQKYAPCGYDIHFSEV